MLNVEEKSKIVIEKRTENLVESIKSTNLLKALVYYLHFGKLRTKGMDNFYFNLMIHKGSYYEYTKLGRKSLVDKEKIILPDKLKEKMIEFFLRTSIPRMLKI